MDNQIFTQSVNAIFHATELGKPEWRAVGLIIQAYSAHEIVDFYGAAPFTDWRNVNRIPPLTYEKGADIYDIIFKDLDEAITCLLYTSTAVHLPGLIVQYHSAANWHIGTLSNWYIIQLFLDNHRHARTQPFHTFHGTGTYFKGLQVKLTGCLGYFPGCISAQVFHIIYL